MYKTQFAKTTDATSNVGGASRPTTGLGGLQKRMTMTGMKFNQAMNESNMMGTTGYNAMGFGDVMGDPSIKKLKEEVALKETQNQELED